MTMAAVFVAQASGVHLTPARQISMLAILMLNESRLVRQLRPPKGRTP
jgi:hypothetical protein